MSANSQTSVNRFDNFCFVARLVFFLAVTAWPAAIAGAQTEAQPALPTVELRIATTSICAEVADEEHERAAGLMFRTSLPVDSGMLFVMPSVGPAGFWMRNTDLPLTLAYIAPDGMILELHDLEPRSEKIVSSRFQNIAYALEMPRGWFQKNNVWPGERVMGLPKPMMQEAPRLRKIP
jgi:uncharacterized membrane protein (UPF0127 family)